MFVFLKSLIHNPVHAQPDFQLTLTTTMLVQLRKPDFFSGCFRMQIPDEIGSKYRLIVLAGERVRQLQKGASPRVTDKSQKFTQIAVQELLGSKVDFHSKEIEVSQDASSDNKKELVGV